MFHRLRPVCVFLVLGISGLACGGSSGTPPDSFDAACQRLADCPTTDTTTSRSEREQACRDNLTSKYDEASGYGCAAAYSDVVSCYASTRDVCPVAGVMQGCESPQQAFRECQGRAGTDECILIANLGGTSGCQIDCALFEAECAAADATGQHACMCRMGDKTGTSFSVAACDEGVEATARSACQ